MSDISKEASIVLDAIANRRSVKYTALKTDPIPRGTMARLFGAANWAPSHKHTEPWRWVVFEGDGRQRFADALTAAYKAVEGEKVKPKKLDKIEKRALHVPVIVAVIMRPSGLVPEWEETAAIGCAMQNFHLAAYALGIGAMWSTPTYVKHPTFREFLDLEPDDKCYGFFYMGYPKGDWPKSTRKAMVDKIRYVVR